VQYTVGEDGEEISETTRIGSGASKIKINIVMPLRLVALYLLLLLLYLTCDIF
jgi:hypothetical protein